LRLPWTEVQHLQLAWLVSSSLDRHLPWRRAARNSLLPTAMPTFAARLPGWLLSTRTTRIIEFSSAGITKRKETSPATRQERRFASGTPAKSKRASQTLQSCHFTSG